VIVPSYNSPDLYLALDSILAQDYGRIQLIVIDDASCSFSRDEAEKYLCDNCQDNIEEYSIIVNERNMGTTYSLNRALKESKGEFIFNLAGDDCFYDSRVLSDWVHAFLETGAEVMTARREVYDENLQVAYCTEPTPKQIKLLQSLSPEELFEEVSPINFIFGCCTARTAESIRKYGCYDERYRLVEDHSMNLSLLRRGVKIAFFNRVVVKYRGGGISSAGRYSEAYEKDVDAILENEILPYTKHPFRVRWKHWKWKRDQKLGARYSELRERWSGSRPMYALVWIWYRLHHPLRSIHRLCEKLNALFRKGV
jgi:glycosyltransferase involved in cell wall biosynthesis